MSIRDHLLHELKASGPLGVESLVQKLNEQCSDPSWLSLDPLDHLERKRAVRCVLDKMVEAGQISVYSHEPVTSWW